MALSSKKRQAKLEKRKKKRKISQKLQNKAAASANCSHKPVKFCYMSNSLFDNNCGVGYIVICRGTDSQTKVAVFLLDIWCLGIKNSAISYMTENEVINELSGEHGLRSISPGEAKGYIMETVDYAKSLGFSPRGDYKKCYRYFDDTIPDSHAASLTFGKNGVPYYMVGPNDNENFQDKVIRTLEKNVGKGNYQYLVEI